MSHLSNRMQQRINDFDNLYNEAKSLLVSEGYKLDPDLIIDAQITLALQVGIVPPMWNGFVICDCCGCMPAGQGIAYKKTSSCSFCHLSEKTEAYSIANANRLEYWKEVRRTTPAPEVDISETLAIHQKNL